MTETYRKIHRSEQIPNNVTPKNKMMNTYFVSISFFYVSTNIKLFIVSVIMLLTIYYRSLFLSFRNDNGKFHNLTVIS